MDAAPTARAPKLRVENVSHRFGRGSAGFLALKDASFTVRDQEFVTIIGPSGCGKSTVFNIMSGLMGPTSGHILIDDRIVDRERGHVGYMMQRDCLMQWRTILENVVLGLEVTGGDRKKSVAQARDLMTRFGLGGFENRYPSALSGGMRQRAALLRTLLLDREVMLLDEPFGALDAITRASMQEWLLSVWSEFRRTVVFITHDVDEAIYLSDRVFVMRGPPGRIVAEVDIQIERPRNYEQTVGLDEFARVKQLLLHYIRSDDEPSANGDAAPSVSGAASARSD